ncbi:MAG: Hsp70 family protein [Gammaproteobacteria bacterium]|nr:Hsp70 family protein [Gammaproteobacteria bacterium]MBU1654065.1 Hsp70 family protein [Gammaproteobacteria bacterium]MBU1962306.1 Hsp70 family protein [Gammaproteobacteria bacterium]
MTETIIGIDLGTTNSEVAFVENGSVRMIPVGDAVIMPSMVGLADDGALLVGRSAHNQYVLHPERSIRSIKRRMGEEGKVALGEKQYTPQEISALILRRLKQAAEDYLGKPLSKAVITVPAYFSDAQRQATRDAGQLADLEVVRIINEPTAAALAYEVEHPEAKNILVYDLGGGTFDVSVVRLSKEVTEVLAGHGNNHLGGEDFDAKLVAHLLEHLREQGIDPATNAVVMARLTRAAERAKIDLSDAPFALIEEEHLLSKDGHPVHLSLEIDRLDYEEMIKPYIDETLEAVHTAMEGAGLTIPEIDEILLVGGATRTPLIQRRLEELFGKQPRNEIDPDLCVAGGAAIQGAVIAGDKVSGVLVDVTPYTFGTSAVGDFNGEPYPFCYVHLIRKNSPVPVTKSEAFYTLQDNQETIHVRVYQGEDPDALNNTEIGSYRIEGLSKVPAGNTIVTTFSLDVNGILKVTSKEKRTGLEKRITIENATARFEQEEMNAARERIDALIGGNGSQVTRVEREYVQARALIEKAGRLLESAGTEDREDLVDLIEALRDTLSNPDEAAIHRAMDQLTDLIYYLES